MAVCGPANSQKPSGWIRILDLKSLHPRGPLSLEKQHPQAASEGATAFFAILGTIRQSGLAGVLIHRSSVIPLALRDVKDRPQSAQWLLFRNLIV